MDGGDKYPNSQQEEPANRSETENKEESSVCHMQSQEEAGPAAMRADDWRRNSDDANDEISCGAAGGRATLTAVETGPSARDVDGR